MYTFNPGPSAVYPAVRQYLTDAFDEGWLSAPHRGERFVQMMRDLVGLLRNKLNIPQDYYIFFTSSATDSRARRVQSQFQHWTTYLLTESAVP